MYLENNEDKPVVAEWFIKTLKGKIYKKMTVNDSKSYVGCLNKLVDQYNNTSHFSIGKKPMNAFYSNLNEEIRLNYKDPKFKVRDRVRITKYKNIFSKGYTENSLCKLLVINCVLKTYPWTYRIKIKNLNGEIIIGSSYEKGLFLSKL